MSIPVYQQLQQSKQKLSVRTVHTVPNGQSVLIWKKSRTRLLFLIHLTVNDLTHFPKNWHTPSPQTQLKITKTLLLYDMVAHIGKSINRWAYLWSRIRQAWRLTSICMKWLNAVCTSVCGYLKLGVGVFWQELAGWVNLSSYGVKDGLLLRLEARDPLTQLRRGILCSLSFLLSPLCQLHLQKTLRCAKL